MAQTNANLESMMSQLLAELKGDKNVSSKPDGKKS